MRVGGCVITGRRIAIRTEHEMRGLQSQSADASHCRIVLSFLKRDTGCETCRLASRHHRTGIDDRLEKQQNQSESSSSSLGRRSSEVPDGRVDCPALSALGPRSIDGGADAHTPVQRTQEAIDCLDSWPERPEEGRSVEDQRGHGNIFLLC